MSNKPKDDLISNLGIDVELETEVLEDDKWANTMLQEVGGTMKVDGLNYVGSIAVHYYLDSKALLKSSYELASKTQITFKEQISEQLALMGFNNAVIAVRKHFNPGYKFRTTRKGDKRGVGQ